MHPRPSRRRLRTRAVPVLSTLTAPGDTAEAAPEKWRDLAESRGGLPTREVVTGRTGRQSCVGTPRPVAAQRDGSVQAGACDGFIPVPHLTPGGLDRCVAEAVPELQDRGGHRTAYPGPTLRDHLGLRHPRRLAAARDAS